MFLVPELLLGALGHRHHNFVLQGGEVGAGVPVSISVCLEKNSSRGIFGSVGGNGEWFVWVR